MKTLCTALWSPPHHGNQRGQIIPESVTVDAEAHSSQVPGVTV